MNRCDSLIGLVLFGAGNGVLLWRNGRRGSWRRKGDVDGHPDGTAQGGVADADIATIERRQRPAVTWAYSASSGSERLREGSIG